MDNNLKLNYGIDAPGVIRNMFIVSAIGFLIAFFAPMFKIGRITIDPSGFIWVGIWCAIPGLLMLLYALSGKFKHRDRMLSMVDWKGNEQVLDVGTGKGLLLIGAAKLLTTGKSTGIDIWNKEDLSGNNSESALQNASIEGVKDKIEIKNENVIEMGFADDHFDVILSNLCIHNIYNKDGRAKACGEIARVLKPGGMAIISDFKHIKEYETVFDGAGLQTERYAANYLTTFPPLSILVVTKSI